MTNSIEDAGKVPTVFDTAKQQLGESYARALLGLGQTNGTVDQLVAELQDFGKVLRQLPQLQAALEAPRVPAETKEALLRKCLEGRSSREFLNFNLLLARRSRFDCYPAIVSSAQELHDEMAGRVRGEVTTAAEISPQSQQKLAAKLSQVIGKQVMLTATVDPQIIGGVVVRVGDTVFDASVANQLQQLKVNTKKRVADSIRASMEKFVVDA